MVEVAGRDTHTLARADVTQIDSAAVVDLPWSVTLKIQPKALIALFPRVPDRGVG